MLTPPLLPMLYPKVRKKEGRENLRRPVRMPLLFCAQQVTVVYTDAVMGDMKIAS